MTLTKRLCLSTMCVLALQGGHEAQAASSRATAASSRPVPQIWMNSKLPDSAATPKLQTGQEDASVHQEQSPSSSLSDKTLIPALRGFVFEASGSNVPQTQTQTQTHTIQMNGLPLLETKEFRKKLGRYLNKPASARTFYDIAQQVTAQFREKGHPFLTAFVPPQRVHDGILDIRVEEYRLGQITVSGNRWFSDRIIRNASSLHPKDTLALQNLQADLAWINGNPFRTVDMIYHPGQKAGTTDVDLQVSDRFPVYLFGSFNNQADPTLGRVNWSLGATWGNAFGIDHTLSYQFTRSLTGRYNMHLGSWEIPLPWRDKVLVYGTYSTSAPAADWPIRNSGISGQASVRYIHQLPHLAVSSDVGLDTLLQAGFDWKTTNSDQFYVASPIMLGNADTDQFALGADITENDHYGQTHLLNEAYYGPGGLTHYDTRKSYQTIFQSAKPDYVYDRVQITRTTNLPYGFSSVTIASAQATTHNLLYSEQLESGGIGTVRGYYVNSALGSRGEQLSEEIKLPSFSVSKQLGIGKNFADTETLGGFYDWGQTWNKKLSQTSSNKTGLASLGIDLNTKINRLVNIVFDTGWRLRPAPDSGKKGAFCDFNIVVGL
ncbi:ShlB/FhaC/HecB family hemolysin secretion/activation protein [Acetobacter malorum]|uniref:ShlB/FhaC/HecB family hemolysin secretion/activation protein n=2 Tax=Acetobacter malorum TaxID=178901 RepID=UPI0039E90ADC